MKRKHSTARREYDQFVRGYVTAALWSSNDERDEAGGEPLDKNYSRDDIVSSSMKSMKRDCAEFMKKNKRDLESYCDNIVIRDGGACMEYAGHDFWLTRNGHGAGFWDRDGISEGLGKRLSDAAHKFGESNLYVAGNDFDKVYVSPEK